METCRHDWKFLWDGIVRRCKQCGVTHYWHFCERQWEGAPNSQYGMDGHNIRVPADASWFVPRHEQGAPPSITPGYFPEHHPYRRYEQGFKE